MPHSVNADVSEDTNVANRALRYIRGNGVTDAEELGKLAFQYFEHKTIGRPADESNHYCVKRLSHVAGAGLRCARCGSSS